MNCPAGFSLVTYKDFTFCVSNDYYKQDGIRMPLTLDEAFAVADANDCVLPTKGVIDAIWEQADIKLSPKPLPPTREMTTFAYFKKHDAIIEEQLSKLGDISDKLIAGHKKDLASVDRFSNRVAIYGWHQSNGKPIQPYSTVHGKTYKDYSHGLRLIKRDALSNGKKVRLGE